MSYFTELCNKYGTDKGTMVRECHGYSYIYEKLFEPIKNNQIKLLEIGIHDPLFPGASLRVYSEYFTQAEIFGFDITDCSHFKIPRVQTFVGDTGKVETLDVLINNGPYNVIIDDGSHVHEHHMICFNRLFKCMAPNSMYIIEDLHAWCSPPTGQYFLNLDVSSRNNLGIKDIKVFCNEKLLVIYN